MVVIGSCGDSVSENILLGISGHHPRLIFITDDVHLNTSDIARCSNNPDSHTVIILNRYDGFSVIGQISSSNEIHDFISVFVVQIVVNPFHIGIVWTICVFFNRPFDKGILCYFFLFNGIYRIFRNSFYGYRNLNACLNLFLWIPLNYFLVTLKVSIGRTCIVYDSFRKREHAILCDWWNDLNHFGIIHWRITWRYNGEGYISWLQSLDSSVWIDWDDSFWFGFPNNVSHIYDFKGILPSIIVAAVEKNL